jgi:hypothetical protein
MICIRPALVIWKETVATIARRRLEAEPNRSAVHASAGAETIAIPTCGERLIPKVVWQNFYVRAFDEFRH